jgi:hypothetical protein
MSGHSFKVWLLMWTDGEHSEAVRAYTLKRTAEGVGHRLQKRYNEGRPLIMRHYFVTQIDLVTHDGCHALHRELLKSVGKNT